MLRTQTKLNFRDEYIESAYRIGKRTEANTRAIFVRFKDTQFKEAVMKNRMLLKGTGIIIADDLTKEKHMLLKEAVSKLGKRNVWNLGSKIFFRSQTFSGFRLFLVNS